MKNNDVKKFNVGDIVKINTPKIVSRFGDIEFVVVKEGMLRDFYTVKRADGGDMSETTGAGAYMVSAFHASIMELVRPADKKVEEPVKGNNVFISDKIIENTDLSPSDVLEINNLILDMAKAYINENKTIMSFTRDISSNKALAMMIFDSMVGSKKRKDFDGDTISNISLLEGLKADVLAKEVDTVEGMFLKDIEQAKWESGSFFKMGGAPICGCPDCVTDVEAIKEKTKSAFEIIDELIGTYLDKNNTPKKENQTPRGETGIIRIMDDLAYIINPTDLFRRYNEKPDSNIPEFKMTKIDSSGRPLEKSDNNIESIFSYLNNMELEIKENSIAVDEIIYALEDQKLITNIVRHVTVINDVEITVYSSKKPYSSLLADVASEEVRRHFLKRVKLAEKLVLKLLNTINALKTGDSVYTLKDLDLLSVYNNISDGELDAMLDSKTAIGRLYYARPAC